MRHIHVLRHGWSHSRDSSAVKQSIDLFVSPVQDHPQTPFDVVSVNRSPKRSLNIGRRIERAISRGQGEFAAIGIFLSSQLKTITHRSQNPREPLGNGSFEMQAKEKSFSRSVSFCPFGGTRKLDCVVIVPNNDAHYSDSFILVRSFWPDSHGQDSRDV